jgi:hypothetical protein
MGFYAVDNVFFLVGQFISFTMNGMEGWDGKIPKGSSGYGPFLWLSLVVVVAGIALHVCHFRLDHWSRYSVSPRPFLRDDPGGTEGTVLAVAGTISLIGWGIATWCNRNDR